MKILKRKKYSILKTILRYSFVFVIAISVLSPVILVQAETQGVNIQTGIDNPLKDGLDTIPKFIEKILEIVLVVGIPIVTLAIIYSGFLFVQARGKPEELTKAKKALVTTLIGAVLLLGAWVLANAIGSTVDEIKRTTVT